MSQSTASRRSPPGELLGRQGPKAHAVGRALLLVAIGGEAQRQARLADVALTDEHDLGAGIVDRARVRDGRARGRPEQLLAVEAPDPDHLVALAERGQ
jgi:hypothetical protein